MHRIIAIALSLLPALLTLGCFPPPGGGTPGGPPVNQTAELVKMVGFMVFFFVIMWVVMIRPQQKKQKEHERLLGQLKSGDRVVANGLLGTVLTVKDNTVSLRSGESKIEVMKHAVSEVLSNEGETGRKG